MHERGVPAGRFGRLAFLFAAYPLLFAVRGGSDSVRIVLALTVGVTGVLAALPALAQQAPPSPNAGVQATAEICGNCVDDDGDGLTDFEDPACCADRQIFPMAIDRGRIHPHGQTSGLGLESLLAAQGLADVNPRREDVFLQIRAERGDEVFCASVPAGRFVAKRPGVFRFRDHNHSVGTAGGIDRLAVRIAGDGSVRFRACARQAEFTSPRDGLLTVTISFRDPLAAESDNRCSTAQELHTNRRGALRVP